MATSDSLASEPVTLHNMLSADNELRVPLFQRPYVWNKEKIDRLWQDIDTVIEEEFDVRFLGALVFDNDYGSTASRDGLYWIIDGQQRIFTLYLALVALVEVALEGELTEIADDISTQYLTSRKSQSKGNPKVKPTVNDTRQFNTILKSALGDHVTLDMAHQQGPSEGALREAYNRVLHAVRTRSVDQDNAVDVDRVNHLRSILLERLELVEILLGTKHDPNEVFDRLNKEGERLGIIDLVRNEVLKRLKDDPENSVNLYHEHWMPFERSFGTSKTRDQYFFPFALVHDRTVTKPKTFGSLSKRWHETAGGATTVKQELALIMDDLHEYLEPYLALSEGKTLDSVSGGVKERSRRLYALNCPTVAYPYLMRLLREVQRGTVSQESAVACLDLVESFLIRRAYMGLEPTGLHAVFKSLWHTAEAGPEDVRAHLQTATIRVPDDEEFAEVVRHGRLYGRRIVGYVLAEYERSFTSGDVMELLPKITVDHVMPQGASGEWDTVISESEKESWMHTWANLVPLSQKANAEKGIDSWGEARAKLQAETVFSSTKRVYQDYSEWNPAALADRADKLAEWAVWRWPF